MISFREGRNTQKQPAKIIVSYIILLPPKMCTRASQYPKYNESKNMQSERNSQEYTFVATLKKNNN